jgi:hypothetical protein
MKGVTNGAKGRNNETCKDLTRIGLSNDRLNRDLMRMFKLSEG